MKGGEVGQEAGGERGRGGEVEGYRGEKKGRGDRGR